MAVSLKALNTSYQCQYYFTNNLFKQKKKKIFDSSLATVMWKCLQRNLLGSLWDLSNHLQQLDPETLCIKKYVAWFNSINPKPLILQGSIL